MRKVLAMLGRLEDSDLDWIVNHGHRRYVAADTLLVEEGVPLDALYILLDGTLRVSLGLRSGNPVGIAKLASGEIVGEISFIDPRPPSASVQAVTDSHVLAISRDALHKHLDEDRAFAANFYFAIAAYLADRLRQTTAQLGYGKAPQDNNQDELNDSSLDEISIAATRFDDILKRLRENG